MALASSKRRLEKSLSLVDELFTKVSEDALFEEPGMQPVRKQLLQRAERITRTYCKTAAICRSPKKSWRQHIIGLEDVAGVGRRRCRSN